MLFEEEQFQEQFKILAGDLIDSGYTKFSLDALFFVLAHHRGRRKDGKTPACLHLVEVGQSLCDRQRRIAAAGLNADYVIALGLLHDILEEYPELYRPLRKKFGRKMADDCQLLNKNYQGKGFTIDPQNIVSLSDVFHEPYFRTWTKTNYDIRNLMNTLAYYNRFTKSPEALLVKLHDRLSNLPTMMNLEPEKQAEYILESKMLTKITKEFCIRIKKTNKKLEVLIQRPRRLIRDIMNPLLDFAKSVIYGDPKPTIAAFVRSGAVRPPNAPRPNSPHDQLLRPTVL